MGRCILFFFVVLAGTSVVRVDLVDFEDLGKDLWSLRVTMIDAKTKVVTYLPVKFRIVDNRGMAKNGLERIELGDKKGLVQGHMTLIGEENELAELEKRIQISHPGCSLKKGKFEAFGLRLRLGDKTVWERPVAGGDESRIVVQGLCDGEGDLNLDGVLVWIEQAPPVNATVQFNLDQVARTVESRFGLNGIVPLEEWTKLSNVLIESGAIMVKVEDYQSKVSRNVIIPLVAKHLQRILTDEKFADVPQKKDEENRPKTKDTNEPQKELNLSLSIGYRLSKTKRLVKQDETLNLRASQRIRRAISISQNIPVQRTEKK